MKYKIPKSPKDGYNLLWKSDNEKETSHHKCFLEAAHVGISYDFTGPEYLYLEQCRSNGEITKWSLLK